MPSIKKKSYYSASALLEVMDPFSLAVGISGLVALSASVLKLIQQYFYGIKHAGEAASELQLLHDVLCRLDGFLRSDIAKGQSFDDTSVLVSSTSTCRIKLEVLYKKLDAAAKNRLLRVLWPLNQKEHCQSLRTKGNYSVYPLCHDNRRMVRL